MFQELKQLFAPTNKDLRFRVLFTLGSLALFIIGTYVQIPGTPNIDVGAFATLNSFTGGEVLHIFTWSNTIHNGIDYSAVITNGYSSVF